MFDEKSWYSKYVKTLLKRSNKKEEKELSDAEFEFVEEQENDQEDESLRNQSNNILHHNSWLFESRDTLSDDKFKTLDDSESTELLLSEKKKKEPLCTKEKCLDNSKNWNSFKRKVPYYIPIFDWLPKYKFSEFFFSDLLAGLTVASVVIPQGIAYSTLANVAPVVGLYTAWMPMITYTLLGTSRQLAIGPEGVVSLLVGTAVTVVPISQSDDYYAVTYTRATLLALMCGIITFTLGILRVGFLDNLISRPILHGFVSASAAVIFVGQLDKLLGFSVEEQEWEKIIGVIEHITDINWVSTAIGISSIIFIIVLDATKKKVGGLARFIPTSLLVVVIMTVISWAFDFAGKYGVVVLDVVEGGFPKVAVPPIWDLNLVKELSIQAILISIVGFVESNAIGKTYATINGYEISANRELVAFGNSNIVSSCFGSFPAFGSLSRSGIANTAGSKTQLYGFWGSLLVLLCILFLMPLFQDLPKSAIAGIVMVAAARLIEFHWMELWQLRAFLEIFLTLFTFVTTFFLGAQLGIVLALGISVFLVVKHTTLPNISVLGRNSEGKWVDINDNPSALTFRGLIVIRLEESLYFGNIEQIVKLIRRIVTLGSCNMHPTAPSLHSDKIEYVIIDGRNIHTMDANSVTVLKEMTLDYNRKGITVFFTHLKEKHVELFHRAKMSDLCEGKVVQSSINRALSVTKQLRVHSANASYNAIIIEHYDGKNIESPERIIINKEDHPEHSSEYIELENKGSDSEREDDIYRGIKDPVDPNYYSHTNL